MFLKSKVRQTNFASEQLWDDSDPERQHEKDVGDADLVATGKLVRLTTDLVHVEGDREDDRRHAEQNHWNKEASTMFNDVETMKYQQWSINNEALQMKYQQWNINNER